MTDAITRKHQIISTGFLNKIKFSSESSSSKLWIGLKILPFFTVIVCGYSD